MSRASAFSLVPAAALALLVALPSAQEPATFTFERGDRVCLLGGALAERMQHDGWLETELQARLPEHELVFRNLGFGGDALIVHQRTMNFGKHPTDDMLLDVPNEPFGPWDRYLDLCDATVVLAFFGFNESFAGEEGLPEFRASLERFIEHVRAQKYDGERAPRLVLFSSTPFLELGNPSLPNGRAENARIELYNAEMADVAARMDVPFVDLFGPMMRLEGAPSTINGIHLTGLGNDFAGYFIAEALAPGSRHSLDDDERERLRQAVVEKNELWFQRYRATDGYNTYGGRSRERYAQGASPDAERVSNYVVLQREMAQLDALCATRDPVIWARARGEDAVPDESSVPPPIPIVSNVPGPLPGGAHRFLGGEDAIERMTTAPGMVVNLFADERRFPELVNPVQMSFDTKGRLWVACWPTYPHWAPGEPMDDKLVILEDTDGDGEADRRTVFADDLHNPTGFEFWNGGVLLAQVPDLVFLRDTDGDDRYDEKTRLLHGLSSGDSHHSANSFVIGPNGGLYFQEGTFHFSQVESVRGPVRNRNGCVWRFDPRTWSVERHIPYDYANPHGHVFDRWGQEFTTDGTGNQNYYALPFSGHVSEPDKHRGYFPFFQQRSRPCAGTEILSSSNFPEVNQQSYLIANVIGFQGIFQYRIDDAGSGFGATELDPIVQSKDRNFRPSDVEVGPDGALYVLDWHNPIIGHLQHHIRDPNRDAAHGRVYRVTYEGRPLSEPVAIAGRPVPELVALLAHPEDRVRYRVRIELSGRDSDEVVQAAREWAAGLDPSDPELEHHQLEALWLTQQHDRPSRGLLESVLTAKDPRARAAGTRVLRYGRHRIPDALEILREMANDKHPRVRLEAVVAASAFDSAEAASVALEALRQPMDKYLDYALGETMRALEPRWKEALRAGQAVADGNGAGVGYLLGRVGPEELVSLPRTSGVLRALLTSHGIAADERRAAAAELAALDGTTPTAELIGAVRAIDAGGGMHAAHVLGDLGALLRETLGGDAAPPRGSLVELTESAQSPAARELGYALLIAADGSADAAYAVARESAEGLQGFLGAVAQVTDADVRAGLFDRVRPLMFSLPGDLTGRTGALSRGGTGVEVGFYDPKPARAALESFEGLSPAVELVATHFTLDLPPANASDRFGLLFRGTVFAPESGSYTFWTSSDDGSMLYLDGRLVVANDGDHAMRSAKGDVQLSAGPHAIVVTYYEQGGGDGLAVSWSGPGIEKTEIPAAALGGSGDTALRAAAVRAMAHVPGRADRKLADAARLVGEGALLDAVVELVRSIAADDLTAESVRPLLDTLAAYVAGLPAEQRTEPAVAAALELGRELCAALPAGDAAAAREQLDGLGGSIVLVRTIPHQMLFDLPEFWVEAGKPVAVVFQNNDVMPHNFVITAPGKMQVVGMAGELLTEGDFIPELDAVLWHTRLLYPGESTRLTFVAPDEPGEHPFVCTFPGHWRVMNGVMHVVAELDATMQIARRDPGADSAPAREFVKDWRLDELLPAFVDGWDRGRDDRRGRALFSDAGCIKCHTIGEEGSIGGPELTLIREKYQAGELLRQILEPSHSILEGYESTGFELDDGTLAVGRIVHEDEQEVHIVEALLNPDDVTVLELAWILDRWNSPVSAMPTGLLVTLTEEEILDLLVFLSKGPE